MTKMTPAAAAALLAVASAYDNRHLTPEAATVWADALAGLRPEDCRQAIAEHYATTTAFVMPAHIRAGVRRIREDRIQRAGDAVYEVPVDPDDVVAYRDAVRARTRQIADGAPVAVAPALPAAERADRRAQFAARLGRLAAATRIPPEDPARERARARARIEPRQAVPQMSRAAQMVALQDRIGHEAATTDAR